MLAGGGEIQTADQVHRLVVDAAVPVGQGPARPDHRRRLGGLRRAQDRPRAELVDEGRARVLAVEAQTIGVPRYPRMGVRGDLPVAVDRLDRLAGVRADAVAHQLVLSDPEEDVGIGRAPVHLLQIGRADGDVTHILVGLPIVEQVSVPHLVEQEVALVRVPRLGRRVHRLDDPGAAHVGEPPDGGAEFRIGDRQPHRGLRERRHGVWALVGDEPGAEIGGVLGDAEHPDRAEPRVAGAGGAAVRERALAVARAGHAVAGRHRTGSPRAPAAGTRAGGARPTGVVPGRARIGRPTARCQHHHGEQQGNRRAHTGDSITGRASGCTHRSRRTGRTCSMRRPSSVRIFHSARQGD